MATLPLSGPENYYNVVLTILVEILEAAVREMWVGLRFAILGSALLCLPW